MSEQLPTSKVPILTNKRFIEGRPESTQEVIELTKGIYELKAINPEIIGASLFGSVLKGTATEKSDYDTNVFVDADRLSKLGIAVTVDNKNDAKLVDETLKKEYSHYIGDYLGKKLGKDHTLIEGGIFIVPLSEKLIVYQLEQYFRAVKLKVEYREAKEQWYEGNMYGQEPEEPEYPMMGWNIGTLFGAELTSGLEGYRQLVLDELQQAGQAGEDAWNDIMFFVKFGEGHLDDKYYPSTVDEAINEYGARKVA